MPTKRERSCWRAARSGACIRLAVLACVCGAFGGEPIFGADAVFDRHEVETGPRRETLLIGRFLPGPFANLALVGVDTHGDRRLSIFALSDGAWQPAVEGVLARGTLFVDVADVGGVDRLLTYQPGRVGWFDPARGAEQLLARLTVPFRASDDAGVPALDIARDLTGNGRDDLLVPSPDGFWIATQAQDGTFAEPIKLGPPEPYLAGVALGETRTYGETGITTATMPWYLSRVHQTDYNQDGLPDLVFWNEDHFDVHFQTAQRQFDPVAKAFTTQAPFDVDGTYALMFEYNNESTLRLFLGLRKKTRLTMLHALRDMNGDGVSDLTTLTLAGRSLTRHRGTYHLYFGAPTPGGTVFPREANTSIQPRGKAGALQASGYSSLWMRDFDGDGDTDVLFRDVAVGLGGMVRAMAGRSVALSVELYRLEDGTFPKRLAAVRRIRPRLYPLGPGVFFPPVLIGDVHGDGRLDLVAGKSRQELRVFAGVDAPRGFERKPQKVAVALPDDERHTRLVDLNSDGKQDIVVYNTSITPRRLTTLIAR